jgi:DNA-directed RNA polymerase subunit RPC12/RpoP
VFTIRCKICGKEYEAYKHQTLVGPVNPHNTSQLCSNCHNIVSKDLSVRIHRCPYCGFVCDRDVNAAINIVDRIPDVYKQSHNLLKIGTVGTTETHKLVETSTAAFDSVESSVSAVAEAGSY